MSGENVLPPPDGNINSGIKFDKARAPKGFQFKTNTDPNDDGSRASFYKEHPEKYFVSESAYEADGRLIPGQVAVFEKTE